MNQPGNDALGDMLSGLTKAAGGVGAMLAKLEESTTPEMLATLDPEKRAEVEALKSKIKLEAPKIQVEADKAMKAATEMLRKVGL